MRRRRAIANGLAVLLLVAIVADLSYSGAGLASALPDVAENLDQAMENLREGDIEQATEQVSDASASADRAGDLTGHPGFRLTTLLPDGRTVEALAEAAELSAQAATEGITAAQKLGVSERGIAASFYQDGVVRLEAITAAEPAVGRAESLLIEAFNKLNGLSEPFLDRLANSITTARSRIVENVETLHKGGVLVDSLPSMLGGTERRRYLLAFQTPSEARATGGFMGMFGILEAQEGRVSIGKIRPLATMFPERTTPVEAPRWFETSYGPQSALVDARQLNVSPHFPAVSKVLLRMYEENTNQRLDGVVAMDPIALSYLMRGMAPIAIPKNSAEPITSETVVDRVLRASYVDFETPIGQERFLAAIIRGFWGKIHSGDFDAPELLNGLTDAVRSQHLKFYFGDHDNQRAIADLEAAGYYGFAGPVVQMVFHNNYSTSKVDYFLQRKIETRVEIRADGEADIRTRVTLINNAPPGPPSPLIGPHSPGDPAGLNRMVLNFLLPPGADIEGYRLGGESKEPLTYDDAGFPVAWDVVEIGPGARVSATLTYDVEEVASIDSEGGEFSMTLFPQATVTPDVYELVVSAPSGYLLREASKPSDSASRTVRLEGLLDHAVVSRIELIPNDE